MHISRSLKKPIRKRLLNSNKIIFLYGSRQVGKTTLINETLNEVSLKTLKVNADERKYIDVLGSRDSNKMRALVSGYDVLFIDEAQRIQDIGINLKILHDTFPSLKIIATGSSSFDLVNKVNEPLTGRTWTFKLLPISFYELSSQHNPFELEGKLEEALVDGTYPELFSLPNKEDKRLFLRELTASYLFKDILEITFIKNSNRLHDLLRLLAFQIGSQVSLSELAVSLGMSKETVQNYIDLLENSHVLFRLPGFSRNLRKETTKMDKIFFCDLGIRNALIDNFNDLHLRDDQGKLWENFLISERMKYQNYIFSQTKGYFWRTYTGAELDYVEEKNSTLSGYEFKFGNKLAKAPKGWNKAYPEASFSCLNRDNYLQFITGE